MILKFLAEGINRRPGCGSNSDLHQQSNYNKSRFSTNYNKSGALPTITSQMLYQL